MAPRKKSRFEKLTEDDAERERQAMQGLVEAYELQPVEDEDATGPLTKKTASSHGRMEHVSIK
jgi:hypothetical protein